MVSGILVEMALGPLPIFSIIMHHFGFRITVSTAPSVHHPVLSHTSRERDGIVRYSFYSSGKKSGSTNRQCRLKRPEAPANGKAGRLGVPWRLR